MPTQAQEPWTVADTIEDMTNWLDQQRRTGQWTPMWVTVEEWRDELVTATGNPGPS